MSEIFGWFDYQNRGTLKRLIEKHHINTAIEVGSFLGLSSVWLAERVDGLTCVDRFVRWEELGIGMDGVPNTQSIFGDFERHGIPLDFYGVFLKNIDDAGVAGKITSYKMDSITAAPWVGPADLVYIDADHSYEGCKADIQAYLPKATKVICGDDFVQRDGFGVIEAVRELLPNYRNVGPFWYAEL